LEDTIAVAGNYIDTLNYQEMVADLETTAKAGTRFATADIERLRVLQKACLPIDPT
jgi:hypothetical protein